MGFTEGVNWLLHDSFSWFSVGLNDLKHSTARAKLD